jgi:hypothetical protein
MGISGTDYEIDFFPVEDSEANGDAIALRWGRLRRPPFQQSVVVIDGGVGESGDTLVEHVRQYYATSTVDYAFCTHPDTNHILGLINVIERLDVRNLVMHRPWLPEHGMSGLFQNGRLVGPSVNRRLNEALENAWRLEQTALRKGVPIHEPFTGFSGLADAFRVVGPSREYYDSLLPSFRDATPDYLDARGGAPANNLVSRFISVASHTVSFVAESFGRETLDNSGKTTPENNSSSIILFTLNGVGILFTGGAGIPALERAVTYLESERYDFDGLKFIQLPNHGSQDNVGPAILDKLVGPVLSSDLRLKLAFVSAAREGSSDFPSKRVTNAFRRRGAPVMLTGGKNIYYHSPDLPKRVGWDSAEPLPLYAEEWSPEE